MKTNRSRLFVAGLLAMACLAAPARGAEKSSKKAEDEAEKPTPEIVLLGRFMLRDLRVTEGTKLRLSFALYAEVNPEHAEVARTVTETHKHRIRSEVITAVRTAQQQDFHEPELERFRRRIFLRLRRTASYLAIERILIGEFELLVD